VQAVGEVAARFDDQGVDQVADLVDRQADQRHVAGLVSVGVALAGNSGDPILAGRDLGIQVVEQGQVASRSAYPPSDLHS
jgi:hypothetical protein